MLQLNLSHFSATTSATNDHSVKISATYWWKPTKKK